MEGDIEDFEDEDETVYVGDAQSKIERLKQAMLAEQAAPEVLPFKTELIGSVLTELTARDEVLVEAEGAMEEQDVLATILYQYELIFFCIHY